MKGFFKKLVQKIWKEKQQKDKIDANGNNKSVPNLIEISDALDELYCLEKLQLYCNHLSRKGIVHTKAVGYDSNSIRLIQPVLALVEERDFNNPAIIVYAKIRQLFETEIQKQLALNDDAVFKKTETLIKTHQNQFDPGELTQIYSYLTNYVIKKLNQGQQSYEVKIIELYNDLLNLRYGVIKRNTLTLHSNIYRNIVKISLRVKDQHFFKRFQTYGIKPNNPKAGFSSKEEWIEKFLEYYKNKLPKKDQGKYHSYCKALFLFSQNEFLAAYKAIGKSSYIQGLYINLDFKVLYLKILYEINVQKSDSNFLRNNNINIPKLLDAYRDILKREKLEDPKLSYQIDYFNDFLNLFRLLYNFQWNYDMVYVHGDPLFKKRKKQLSEAINHCAFNHKEWFKNKLDQLLTINPHFN